MAAPMSQYELERQLRLEENKRRMEELGLLQQKSILESFGPRRAAPSLACKPPKQTYLSCGPRKPLEPRRSRRLQGEKVDYCEIGDNDLPVHVERGGAGGVSCSQGGYCGGGGYHELLDLMERGSHHPPSTVCEKPAEDTDAGPASSSQPEKDEIQEQLQQIRCSSQGRGSVYDSSLGITCHFCRQKKLCGEENCPRCQYRDSSKECIGKTNCSKCCSAFGKFCRACLLIRYGQTLEEATAQMEAGTWLCPHCYEDEHPDAGWICNSSICMKRRGLKPTGIAIYDAQQRGFKSVAHLLQAQLQKKGGIKALSAAAAAAAGEEPEAPQAAGEHAAAAEQGVAGPSGQAEQVAGAGAERAADGDDATTVSGRTAEAVDQDDTASAPKVRGRGRPLRGGKGGALGVASGRVAKQDGAKTGAGGVAAAVESADTSAGGGAVRRSARSKK